VTDIYRPLIRRKGPESHYLWVSRVSIVGFGALLVMLAYVCYQLQESVLWVALKILTVPSGSMLGVFLLGLLTKRRANRGNVVAMIVSAAAMAILLGLGEGKKYIAGLGWDWLTGLSLEVTIGWSWLIVIGTVMTFVLGYLLGRPPPAEEPGPGERRGGEATAAEGAD
jgi:Na+/proline symporter